MKESNLKKTIGIVFIIICLIGCGKKEKVNNNINGANNTFESSIQTEETTESNNQANEGNTDESNSLIIEEYPDEIFEKLGDEYFEFNGCYFSFKIFDKKEKEVLELYRPIFDDNAEIKMYYTGWMSDESFSMLDSKSTTKASFTGNLAECLEKAHEDAGKSYLYFTGMALIDINDDGELELDLVCDKNELIISYIDGAYYATDLVGMEYEKGVVSATYLEKDLASTGMEWKDINIYSTINISKNELSVKNNARKEISYKTTYYVDNIETDEASYKDYLKNVSGYYSSTVVMNDRTWKDPILSDKEVEAYNLYSEFVYGNESANLICLNRDDIENEVSFEGRYIECFKQALSEFGIDEKKQSTKYESLYFADLNNDDQLEMIIKYKNDDDKNMNCFYDYFAIVLSYVDNQYVMIAVPEYEFFTSDGSFENYWPEFQYHENPYYKLKDYEESEIRYKLDISKDKVICKAKACYTDVIEWSDLESEDEETQRYFLNEGATNEDTLRDYIGRKATKQEGYNRIVIEHLFN